MTVYVRRDSESYETDGGWFQARTAGRDIADLATRAAPTVRSDR